MRHNLGEIWYLPQQKKCPYPTALNLTHNRIYSTSGCSKEEREKLQVWCTRGWAGWPSWNRGHEVQYMAYMCTMTDQPDIWNRENFFISILMLGPLIHSPKVAYFKHVFHISRNWSNWKKIILSFSHPAENVPRIEFFFSKAGQKNS